VSKRQRTVAAGVGAVVTLRVSKGLWESHGDFHGPGSFHTREIDHELASGRGAGLRQSLINGEVSALLSKLLLAGAVTLVIDFFEQYV